MFGSNKSLHSVACSLIGFRCALRERVNAPVDVRVVFFVVVSQCINNHALVSDWLPHCQDTPGSRTIHLLIEAPETAS
jgi:hypothetical protein